MTFWRWCDAPASSWQWSQSQWQSRTTSTHDSPSINAENTNSHGSIHAGNIDVCANSGANSDTTDNTIGNTQQNKCGASDAIIPILTALFFIYVSLFGNQFITFLCVCNRLPRKLLTWRSHRGSNLDLILRRNLFYPVELWEHGIYFIPWILILQVVIAACIIPPT